MSGTVARLLGALGDAIGGTANVNFDSNTLFIDGVNNRVGMGTSGPVCALEVAAVNPTRGIVAQINNAGPSSLTGTQLSFLQNTINWWAIGQPAATDAFAIWQGRHVGGDGTERLRINNSGEFILGKTSTDVTANGVVLTPAGPCYHTFTISNNEAWIFNNRNTSVFYTLSFRTVNNQRGSISVSDSGVTYNTSSDYRLKENITIIANAGERLLNLKPCRFNFISDPTCTVDGFLAHEAAEVVPEAVTGEKDAVNEDGSIKAQGIDHSKLVPLLTAALQEALLSINDLKAEVQTMKTKIAALESN